MAHSEVLLLKPVENLGGEGDQVRVRAGYARNFLLPRQLAAPLTVANRKQVDALKQRRATREAAELTGAQELAAKLAKLALAFAVKTGEGGKMFGAITAADLHAKIAEGGITLDKRKVHLATPVKTLGKHEAKIRLHPEVSVDITFDVVSENPIVEVPAEGLPAEARDDRPGMDKKSVKRTAKKDAPEPST